MSVRDQKVREVTTAGVPAPSPALPRAIGFLGSTAIVIGTTIGSGIFLVPHNVARQVGSEGALYAVWVIGGLLSLAGALSLAELGTAMPDAGGVYVYLRQAYGKLFAFLYGWAALAVIESGSIATLAVAFGIYASSFFPLGTVERAIVAAFVIALLTWVNILGVRKGAAVQTFFTVAKLLGVALIMGYAWLRSPSPVTPASSLTSAVTSASSFGVALVGVLWAYQGWHFLSYAAGEVKDPSLNLPRSYLVGTLVVVGVYLGANAAYLRVLPLGVLAERERVAAEAMQILAGARGSAFVTALILCSIFGALNGSILGGARVLFAMGRDGVFFSSVGLVHRRFQTPAAALVVQGIWSIALAASGTFEQLYTYVIFTAWLFYGAAVMGIIVLRRRQPALARPYRVWGYPVLPVLFALAALAIVANTLFLKPKESFLGLGLVLIGIPIYAGWRHWARR